LESEFFPSKDLQLLETRANNVFHSYCQQYYDNATSSVYFMDPSEGARPGFNAVYLVKKEMGSSKATGCKEACWDGTHIVMCDMDQGKKVAEY